jgi:arsenate reductase-like glutaredoxin family protein
MGITLDERDFFKDRFTENEFRKLIGSQSPTDFFSWKSPSFKKLNLDTNLVDSDDLIRLMIAEPRLIRRPLIKIGGKLILGTNKSEIDNLFLI